MTEPTTYVQVAPWSKDFLNIPLGSGDNSISQKIADHVKNICATSNFYLCKYVSFFLHYKVCDDIADCPDGEDASEYTDSGYFYNACILISMFHLLSQI